MHLYRIILPVNDNGGKPCNGAHASFQAYVIDKAGGLTTSAATGAGHTGARIQREGVIAYDVACDAQTFDKLVTRAIELFPDQVAIFTATIGTALFVEGAGLSDKPVTSTDKSDFDV
jgi:hypothetical protein